MMLADLDNAVRQQLVARNGEILQYILAQPALAGIMVFDDDGEYEEIELNGFAKAMYTQRRRGALYQDPDDFSSGDGEFEFGPHYGFERTS